MNDTPDTPTNDDEPSDMKSDIATLASKIEAARSEVAAGKVVDLSTFLPKVTAFCGSVSTNPPIEAKAPMIMASIEALLNGLDELSRELVELEASLGDSAADGGEDKGEGGGEDDA